MSSYQTEIYEVTLAVRTVSFGPDIQSRLEEEIRAKAAKTTYKTVMEAAILKPENLSEPVLRRVAKVVGVKFESMVLAYALAKPQVPTRLHLRAHPKRQ